jgi:long-chain acyl-CoA synthetase
VSLHHLLEGLNAYHDFLSRLHLAAPSLSHTEPAAGVDTVHDVLLYAARTHGKKKGFAARDIERTITEEKEVTKTVGGKQQTEKKQWNYFKLKPFEWWTYEEMLANVRQVGSGLRSLGVGGEGETFFNIYGSTSCVSFQLS